MTIDARLWAALRLLTAAGIILSAAEAAAQFNRGKDKRKARDRVLEEGRAFIKEHSDALEDARYRKMVEDVMEKEESPGRQALEALGKLEGDPRSRPLLTNEQQLRETEAASLFDKVSDNLSPEARAILSQAPVQVVQALDTGQGAGSGAAPVSPGAAFDPAAVPLPPLPKAKRVEDEIKAKLMATITAQGGAYFHASDKIVIFFKEVVVDHRTFYLECDKLEVFLKESMQLAGVGDPTVPAAPEAAETPTEAEEDEEPIEKAIATGGTVTITKKASSGVTQIGKARTVIYDAATENIIMRDFPSLQKGSSLIKAIDPSTVITLTPNGDHTISGPTTVEFLPEEDKAPAPAPSPAPAAPAAAAAAVSP